MWNLEARRDRSPRFPYPGASAVLLALVFAGGVYALSVFAPSVEPPRQAPEPPATTSAPPPPPSPPETETTERTDGCPEGCTSSNPGCEIKGNISKERERIYHLPGQRYYDKTVISPEKGERWFCTGEESEENGWRRAKV